MDVPPYHNITIICKKKGSKWNLKYFPHFYLTVQKKEKNITLVSLDKLPDSKESHITHLITMQKIGHKSKIRGPNDVYVDVTFSVFIT